MKTSNVKRILCGCLLFAATWPAFSQPATNPRLIIRADDMGSFRSANIACMEGYKNGVETCIEVMVVTSWFPEAARLLRENPGIDVGLHLTFTSEWDNVKWRPLTHCPSLTDSNGYFLPMMSPNSAYPGLAILENTWSLAEIEQEARAQIEMALKNIPQISHISGHMGSTGFDPEVVKLMRRLSEEYHLPVVDRVEAMQEYDFTYSGYDGASKTPAEKEASFIRMLDKLEPGKRYMFLDHPALDKAFGNYLRAVKKADQDLHSIMILQHGKVVKEQWLGEGDRHTPHVLNSVSKTFTATAIGFAVAEGKLKVTDKVISFFPDQLPAEVSPYLKELEIRHLLTMSSGHDVDPTALVRQKGNEKADWAKLFLSAPLVHKPGTYFVYNSLGTYMLSAIIQKVTGEKVINYLYPRLFRPLGIVGATWEESPQGVNCGGWGLYLKTEDLAKMGQFFLQKGKWNDKQLLPESWIEEATTSKIASLPAGMRPENLKMKPKDSDWLQGYGYQMWRCRHNAVRADGANGQYIIILPEQDAVIAMTANIGDMQAEINLIWKYILPALR